MSPLDNIITDNNVGTFSHRVRVHIYRVGRSVPVRFLRRSAMSSVRRRFTFANARRDVTNRLFGGRRRIAPVLFISLVLAIL